MEPVPQSEPVVAPVTAAVAAKPVWPSAYSLLKQSLSFYKTHAKKFFALGAVPSVISLAIALITLTTPGGSLLAMVGGVVIIVLGIAGAVVGVAQHVAIIKSIEVFEKNESLSVKKAYGFGFSFLISMLWIGILTGFIIWGGVLALIIPAFVLGVYLSLGYFTLALEGKTGLAALTQSTLYVKGNGWQVFRKMAYLGLAAFGLYIIVSGLIVLVSLLTVGGDAMTFLKEISDKVRIVYNLITDIITFTVLLPIMFAYNYMIYKHARSLRDASPITEAETAKTRRALTIWGIVGIFAIIAFVALMIGSL